MDIQRWLHNTADRVPPDSPDHPPGSAFLRTPGEADNPTRRYRRKRKRAASDSSIIPQQYQPADLGVSANEGGQAGRTRHSEDFGRSLDSGSQYAEEQKSPAGIVSPDDAAQQAQEPYERRARRKTKADHYEPKRKKGRQKKDDKPRAVRSKQERRKSHRSRDGGRTAGLVQSFQLKNGPKNHRLTLKPDNNAGLFKHGRASAQLAGRGKGLPDLVFNELRFLVRPDEHQDEVQPEDAKHDKSAKERKRQLENGEISNYFEAHQAQQKPQEEDKATARRRRSSSRTRLAKQKSKSRVTNERSPALEEAELPEVPYPGFGSRRVVHHSRSAHRSTSYLTWSETPPVKAGPKMPEDAATAEDRAVYQIPTRRESMVNLARHGSTPTAASKSFHGLYSSLRPDKQASSKRGQRSARTSVREPFAEETRANCQEDSVHTSQSLPQHPVYGAHRRSDETGGEPNEGPSEARSYRTSDILKVRGRMEALIDQQSSRPYDGGGSFARTWSSNHPEPTSMSGLLRDAQQAVFNYEAANMDANVQREHDMPTQHEQLAPSIPRSASDNRSQHLRGDNQMDSAVQWVSERFWHPAIRPSTSTTRSTRHPPGITWRQPSIPAEGVADEPEDNEMLDNAPDTAHYLTGVPDETAAYVPAPNRDFRLGTAPVLRAEPYHSAESAPLDEPWSWPRSRTDMVPIALGRPSSTARDASQSGIAMRALYEQEDLEDKDFWKPNQLS